MKSKKKTKNAGLDDLRRSLEKAGLFVQALTENGANIKPLNGKFSVKRTDRDILLTFEKRKLSLSQYGLRPFVERKENEYDAKNLFVVILK